MIYGFKCSITLMDAWCNTSIPKKTTMIILIVMYAFLGAVAHGAALAKLAGGADGGGPPPIQVQIVNIGSGSSPIGDAYLPKPKYEILPAQKVNNNPPPTPPPNVIIKPVILPPSNASDSANALAMLKAERDLKYEVPTNPPFSPPIAYPFSGYSNPFYNWRLAPSDGCFYRGANPYRHHPFYHGMLPPML